MLIKLIHNILNKNHKNKKKQEEVSSKRIASRKSFVNTRKIIAFNISNWKRNFIDFIFEEYKILYAPLDVDNPKFSDKWRLKLLNNKDINILIWGSKTPQMLAGLENNRFFVEDGFIRSVDLGSKKTPPFSLTIDRSCPYYDSTRASDLETLLATYDFESDQTNLRNRSKTLIQKIINNGISKYNNAQYININQIYGEKRRKRILVIGQVEDDASIKYGSKYPYTNNDLVKIARMENPDAEIFYKPHPDVLAKTRSILSDPNEVKGICTIIENDIPIAQAFETIDHVYTITSQTGFEALLRGIRVTTLGCPFYSGWGLTDDRQLNNRRFRKLTIEELFAISYIKYPLYFDPYSRKMIDIDKAIDNIIALRGNQR